MEILNKINKFSYKMYGECNYIVLHGRIKDVVNDSATGYSYLLVERYAGDEGFDNKLIKVFNNNKQDGEYRSLPTRLAVGKLATFEGVIVQSNNETYLYFKRNWVNDEYGSKESFCLLSGNLRIVNDDFRIYQHNKFYTLELSQKQKVLYEDYFNENNADTRMAVFANLINGSVCVTNMTQFSKLKTSQKKFKNLPEGAAL